MNLNTVEKKLQEALKIASTGQQVGARRSCCRQLSAPASRAPPRSASWCNTRRAQGPAVASGCVEGNALYAILRASVRPSPIGSSTISTR